MSKQTNQLEQLLEMTRQMLSLAEQQKWSVLAKMQVVRLKLIEKTFPIDTTSETETSRSILEQIVGINTQLTQTCKQNKRSLQLELSGINSGRKAMAAYQSV
jgi:hypothetical protein